MPDQENDKSQNPQTTEEKQAEITRIKNLGKELRKKIPSGPNIPTGTDTLRRQRDELSQI